MKQNEQFVDEFDWLSNIIAGGILAFVFYFVLMLLLLSIGVV